jgi:hypothetical protein
LSAPAPPGSSPKNGSLAGRLSSDEMFEHPDENAGSKSKETGRAVTLNVEPGLYVLDDTLRIGSIRVVGRRRHFVVGPALGAFYDYICNLLGEYLFNKNRSA